MNVVREINKINQRELELGVKGSWHDEYKDSAYVFVGGLSYDLTEGDVITIMSQWGEVMDINMPRDQETGKPKGFCFLMYEDQRSTVLAVDNMTGAQVLGRTIRVDHCKKYEQKGTKNESGDYIAPEEPTYNAMPPTLDGSSDESSSDSAADNLDEEDPMAAYLRQQKKTKKITDGKKRKRDGETKEDKKARKEDKRRRKEERDRKRKARDERKSKVGSPSGRASVKREDSGVGRSREEDIEDKRSRKITSPLPERRVDSREVRGVSREEQDTSRSRSRFGTERDEPRRSTNRDSPESSRPRSRPRVDGSSRDVDPRRHRELSDEPPRRRHDDDRRRTEIPVRNGDDRREEVAPARGVRMNPERERLLAGNRSSRDRNDDRRPPRDDRYDRRY